MSSIFHQIFGDFFVKFMQENKAAPPRRKKASPFRGGGKLERSDHLTKGYKMHPSGTALRRVPALRTGEPFCGCAADRRPMAARKLR